MTCVDVVEREHSQPLKSQGSEAFFGLFLASGERSATDNVTLHNSRNDLSKKGLPAGRAGRIEHEEGFVASFEDWRCEPCKDRRDWHKTARFARERKILERYQQFHEGAPGILLCRVAWNRGK